RRTSSRASRTWSSGTGAWGASSSAAATWSSARRCAASGFPTSWWFGRRYKEVGGHPPSPPFIGGAQEGVRQWGAPSGSLVYGRRLAAGAVLGRALGGHEVARAGVAAAGHFDQAIGT